MEKKSGSILVVDDEQSMCDTLRVILSREGYTVETATKPQEALDAFAARPHDLVIQDLRLPGADGISLLEKFKALRAETQVIIITAYKTWESTVRALRLGAHDYLDKPFDNETIRTAVEKAFRRAAKVRAAGDESGADAGYYGRVIVGNSPAMNKIMTLVRKIAATASTVLIQGESGTGKELIARAIHYLSARSNEAFIGVNCGAFTESLLESELFGHVKGAFTGAVANKKGLIEVADRGTFFLDEVTEMSAATQVKFLRFLEEREFLPVGASKSRRVDVRIVTATARQLDQEVAAGRFRRDLYYRLNVIPIAITPLRERPEDVPLLARHFLALYAKSLNKPVRDFQPEALAYLESHPWPGNVRELENAVQRAVALTENDPITLADLRGAFSPAAADQGEQAVLPPEGIALESVLAEQEKRYLEQALAISGNNLTQAAGLLGLSFRSIRYKLKKYGIKRGKG